MACGKAKIWFHSFLISALDRGEYSILVTPVEVTLYLINHQNVNINIDIYVQTFRVSLKKNASYVYDDDDDVYVSFSSSF
jgi:hypothetical protein